MILIDYSQVMISSLMMHLSLQKDKTAEINENMIRHMVLQSILFYKKKFAHKWGPVLEQHPVVICCDDQNYWRKSIFPHYKASRKKDRAKSPYDWNAIFTTLNTIKDELRDNFPYAVVQVPGAEADDIIASLIADNGYFKIDNSALFINNVIISGDKDFMQLQKYANVEQWSPITKKMMVTDNPERYLREHIILGDQGDGIPNYLSDDDTFVTGKRQRPIPRAKMNEWTTKHPMEFCTDQTFKNYVRNENLISFDKIPKEIGDACIQQYATSMDSRIDRSGIIPYLMKHRLSKLTERAQEF